jgi:cell division protease FtsH
LGWLLGPREPRQQQQKGPNDKQAPRFEPQISDVRFSDVAGCDEAKVELMEVVEFLKDPDVFAEMGAKIPRGVLLIGPPGTGKTLLGQAVAGEARVPFFYVSGSEFVEMFVGVGAARMRELFAKAAEDGEAAIIFIDEVDAAGKKRSNSASGGGSDERDTTLNQLLVELDGKKKSKIIFMAATNRPDMLDPALLRPGRLDRHVLIDGYDVNGREQILQIHTRRKPLAEDVKLRIIAERTPGMSGAQLAAICNEAAILASRRIRAARANGEKSPRYIFMSEFYEAIDRVTMGAARGSRAKVMSDADKKNTAYHEVGHAGLAESVFECDRVTKLTIMPRGQSLGHAQTLPDGDRWSWTEEQLRARIIMMLGGRVAVKMFLNAVDTGPSSDYDQAWNLARAMVVQYGMSRLGPVRLTFNEAGKCESGPKLLDEVDSETRRIIAECETDAIRILRKRKKSVHRASAEVTVKETLQGDEFRAVWGNPRRYRVNCRRTFGQRLRARLGIMKAA